MPTWNLFREEQNLLPTQYDPVPSTEGNDHEPKLEQQTLPRTVLPGAQHDHEKIGRSRNPVILNLSIGLNILLSLALVLSVRQITMNRWSNHGSVYSPAQNAVRREDVVFQAGIGRYVTPYQGRPDDKNNQLWQDLYSFGMSRISADEARPMVNKTLPIPGDSDHYLIELSVFHQLHCLNMLRQGLYGDVDWTNTKPGSMGIKHLDHCIDIIRQNLQCSADITPITWIRSSAGPAKGVVNVLHTCRNFTAIQQWARDHETTVEFDYDAVVDDDPLGWGHYGLDEE